MKQGFIKQHQSFFTLIQELADAALIGLSLSLALYIQGHEWVHHYHVAFVCFALGFYVVARYSGLYQSWRVQAFSQEASSFLNHLFLYLSSCWWLVLFCT